MKWPLLIFTNCLILILNKQKTINEDKYIEIQRNLDADEMDFELHDINIEL